MIITECQSGSLKGPSLKFLQFRAMIATEKVVMAKKLKIKFTSKRIDESVYTTHGKENEKSEMTKLHKCTSHSSVNKKMSISEDLKVKFTMQGAKKRGPEGLIDDRSEKRQKMDRSVMPQCACILKKLMTHPAGWVFNKPVDPVALNIPDYFSIISQPMDLGTIKSKLEKNVYVGTEEFAADVRLTFSNAMLYNPPANNVHLMAKELNGIFSTRWKSLEGKWKQESVKFEKGRVSSEKMNDTQKVKRQKAAQNCRNSSLGINFHKGSDCGNRHAPGPANTRTSASPIVGSAYVHATSSDLTSEKSLGRDRRASCGDASKLESQPEKASASQTSKSDPDSDGAVSALDEETVCPSSQLVASAVAAANADASVEGWDGPIVDVQLSPKKALRAAILKTRFADTILKAQQKTLLDHGDKGDPAKLQQEKERLEKKQREEKARIEAQIRAAEAASRLQAEAELKMQREREREAARLALQKMEKTVEFDENQKFLKDLEMLSCSLNDHSMDSEDGSEVVMGPYFGNPLERLGLFMKNDYIGDEDEEEAILNGDGDGFSDGNGEITLSGNADEDMRGEGEYAEDQEETILNGGGDENGENGICVDRNGLEEDYGDRKNEDENNEDGEEGEIVS